MKRVRFWHLKALGYCNRQMRVWCKAHGVSWLELRKEGIEADRLLALDDSAMARDAVDFAEASGWSSTPVMADNSISGGCV
jgi:hypothetical protein